MKENKLLIWGILGLIFLASPDLAQAEAGWDNGFYIKSEDGDFKMKVGGTLQLQELIQARQATEAVPAGAARPTQAANDFSDSFLLRRIRLATTGTLFGNIDWFTIVGASTARQGNPTTLWFAGFTVNIIPEFNLSGGMVQLPMDRMGENSSSWYLGVEPPLTATQEDGVTTTQTGGIITIARDSLSMPFDLGLRADGDIGKHFSYAFGLANGNGFQNANVNNELSYGARAVIHVLEPVPYKETDFDWSETPKLSVGMGTGFEDEDAADENFAAVTRRWSWLASGDVAFRYHGFSLNSELYYRIIRLSAVTVEDTNGDRRLQDVGYYANAGYFVLPKKLELMLTGAQIFREGPDNNANEFGGGINWYLKGNKAKFQFDYTNVLDYDEVPGLNNATYHKFRAMFSLFI